jgi:nucleolar protein 15
LGHIPHGFFEPQMHAYFSQFGIITRLRLARNRRTGKSKHFAYVEFVSKDVAEVVAETMDGYLIPPHRLVCKAVEVEERVWKGANSVFRKIPWTKVNRERLEGKKSRAKWEELVRREDERKIKRTEKISAAGIEYEFPVGQKKRKGEGDAQGAVVKIKKARTEKGESKVSRM